MVKDLKEVLLDDFWIMPATPKYINNGVPYITSKNIKNEKIDFSNVNYINIEDYERISKNRPILIDDILISMIGTLGEVAVVKKSDGVFYGQNMFLVRLNKDKIYQRYFINYFKSNIVKRQLMTKQNKSTQSYLKANHIESLKIPIPDIAEQKKIANKLDKVQEIINMRKKQIDELDELIKSQFVEMFGSVELNDKEFEEIEINRIADISSSKRIYANEYKEKGVPFYRSKEIIELGNKKKPSIELFISEERYKEIKEKYDIPIRGDILITAVGTIGETWIVDTDEPFYYKDGNVLQIRLKKEISKIYFKYVLDILINLFKSKNVSGSAYSALTIEKFRKMKIILPPIELQNQFAEIVKVIDKQKFEMQSSLEETQKLQESLMNKYFG